MIMLNFFLGSLALGWWRWTYPGSDVTKAETILMILTFVLRHKISGEGLKDFLSLLHILFPSILPATKYLFDKYFLSITNQYEIHFYCESCKGYICKVVIVLTKCPHCDVPFDIASNLKSGSFMIYCHCLPHWKMSWKVWERTPNS